MNKIALLIAVVMSGCVFPNAPREGAKCMSAWSAECVNSNVIAYCEDDKWKDYACPSECRDLQTPRCNWLQAKEDDSCPKAFERFGFCTAVGTAFMCLGGKWTAVTCNQCTPDALALVPQPQPFERPTCVP